MTFATDDGAAHAGPEVREALARILGEAVATRATGARRASTWSCRPRRCACG